MLIWNRKKRSGASLENQEQFSRGIKTKMTHGCCVLCTQRLLKHLARINCVLLAREVVLMESKRPEGEGWWATQRAWALEQSAIGSIHPWGWLMKTGALCFQSIVPIRGEYRLCIKCSSETVNQGEFSVSTTPAKETKQLYNPILCASPTCSQHG